MVVGHRRERRTRATFRRELAAIATSIALEARAARPIARRVLAEVLAALDHDIEHVAHRGLGSSTRTSRSTTRSSVVSSLPMTASSQGVAKGIHLDGRLVVERSDGTLVRVASGEVAFSGFAIVLRFRL